MASLMAKRHREEADHDVAVAKNVLRRFLVDNAPRLKYVEACEWYDSSARSYCVAEQYHKAIDCYKQAADMCVRQISAQEQAAKKNIFKSGACFEGELESLVFRLRAANLEEESDPVHASSAYRDAIRACCDLGLYDLAATLQMRIINLQEWDFRDGPSQQSRITAYLTAADLFGAAVQRGRDESKRNAQRACLLQAAELDSLANEPKYVRSAEAFEAIATEVLRDNMTAYNAVRLFFKSALCFLVAADHDVMRGKLKMFAVKSIEFALSPERTFLLDVNACVLREPLPDHDDFVDRCYHLASVRKLDAWELSMLGIVNQRMADKVDAHDRIVELGRFQAARDKEQARVEREKAKRLQREQNKVDKQTKRVR
ncbi:soluble NSF attachment protein [Pelagophyceae sp. CCMP2097]|nr:soluble NSF attachment protein [Pelagophyceae sp. CCMP2097]|mmetsp:Transcript_4141/g.12881  ORF Transcript_4141/g.12881 Transcript_4141/m.12881 type:complete len:372 (-) Transcript_4141:68-1183(-)